jgi:TrmH family RNA methyltransferase
MIDSIASSQNSKFQLWKSLLKSKGIKEHGLFLLSGEKLIFEFLKDSDLEIVSEIITPGLRPQQSRVPSFELSKDLFNELDVVGTHFNLFVLKTPTIQAMDPRSEPQGLEVITPVGDPLNLGAMIRSAVAFQATKIILTTESANPFLPKCVKASSGSVLTAPLFTSGPLNVWDSTYTYALDSVGENLNQIQIPKNFRILIGEEGPGLGQLQNVKKIKIPTNKVESLNATVAASLVMWEHAKIQTGR